MNYKLIYDRIVARGKERILEGYKERHHIVPRCMGGTDDPDNLVDLTPEEHFVCHQLLVKIYPENPRLIHAVTMMTGEKRGNKLYGWHRRRASLPRKTQFKIICTGCSKEILKTEYYFSIVRYPTKFCSRKCKDQFGNITQSCKQCGESFTCKRHKNRSFCSHNCTWAYKRENKIFNLS